MQIIWKIPRRGWQKIESFAQRWGINIVLAAALYLSLYIWLPIAPFVPIPLWAKGAIVAVLYAAPFLYVVVALAWRFICPPQDFDIEVRPFNVDLIGGYPELTTWFRQFWATSGPWGEYLRCQMCADEAGAGLYDTVATISFREAKKLRLEEGSPCPKCGNKLGMFWTDTSTEAYVQNMIKHEDFRGILVFVNDHPAGWHLSYAGGESDEWYLDTIAILPEFRERPARYPILTIGLQEMALARKKGYQRARMRTHRRAIHVIVLARLFGYKLVGPDPRDRDRVYYEAPLTWRSWAKSWVLLKALEASPRFERWLTKK